MKHQFNIFCKLMLGTLSLVGVAACKNGGDIQGAKSSFSSAPTSVNVVTPILVSPLANPYYSKENSILVSAICTTGFEVKILGALGDIKQSSVCLDNLVSFNITNLQDGIYPYFMGQIDSAGSMSTLVPITLIRKSSIAKPVVTTPAVSVYLSADAALLIAGTCESGASINLGVDGVGTTTCVGSQFSMTLPKAADGDYTISVSQTDQAGNTDSQSFQWKKHSLIVSPNDPTLQVASTQVFAFSGGSGTYTCTLVANPSGGSYDANTKTYTAGQISGVIDQLRLTDSQGNSKTVQISTTASLVDHFEYSTVSGNNQTVTIGTNLPTDISAKVVDRYGNPIPFYVTYFQVMQGDSTIVSNAVQTSDLSGNVKVQVRSGVSSRGNQIIVSPLTGTLPDLALTGRTKLPFNFLSTFAGKGNLGSYFGTGQNPNSVALGDVDADGKIDALVLNSGDPSIGILLGYGNGLFQSMTKKNGICSSPNGMLTADFNGDSKIDIAITCGNSISTAIQILLGVGDGTFGNPLSLAIDPLENIPNGIVSGDFNSDGKLDLASSSSGSASVSIRTGAGDGTFSVPTVISVGISPSGLAVLDFNKDGKNDLIVLNSADGTYTIVRNLGSMSFDSSLMLTAGNGPTAVAVKDFNRDNFDDIAILNTGDGSISIQLNDQTGGFYEATQLFVGTAPSSILSVDINKDTFFDLVVTNNGDSTLSYFTGRGNGFFDSYVAMPSTDNPTYAAILDVNGDTYKDIVVVGSGNRQLEFKPGHAIGTQFGYEDSLNINPVSAVIDDFNGDGKIDYSVLSKGNKSVDVFFGSGNGLFTVGPSLNTTDFSEDLVAVDLTRTGAVDLIAANSTKSSIRIFPNSGTGTFATPIDVSVSSGPVAIGSGDFNRDGKLDLVVVNQSSNTVSLLLSNGVRSFDAKVDYPVGTGPSAMSVGDFNGDGILDLVVLNKGGGTFSILLGLGDGTFQAHVDYSVGAVATQIKTSDLNGDGVLDLAITLNSDQVVSVLMGNGDGSFKPANNYSAGLNPFGLAIGDINGDGNLDLVVINQNSFSVTLLQGSPIGNYSVSFTTTTPGSFSNVFLGDFNNDKAVDLLFLNAITNTSQVRMGH